MAIEAHVDDQDLAVHAANYHRFMLGLKWVGVCLAALLPSLILWFATPAGFFWALIVGVAIFAVGAYAMTHGLAHSSESDNPLSR
ncbi:MAG: hypothetical protein P4L73_09195 [Caulobacteraceae bacterium]|nr:hypothetical protein [Caulobacteraceae bacterium]